MKLALPGIRGRMPGLDGLRALAVIAVVWHHSHPGFASLPASSKGFLGVDVFFVLSGFLITTLLLEEKASSGTISLSNFYARRTLRIFPLYYAVILGLGLYFLIAASSSSQSAPFARELGYHLTYTSNWISLHSLMAITWSLSTEEQFYLVWPPLLAWLGVARALPLLVAFLLLNQAINFRLLDDLLLYIGIPYSNLSILQVTFTPILFGVALAIAVSIESVRRNIQRLVTGPSLWLHVVVIAIITNLTGDMSGTKRLLFHIETTAILAGIVLQPRHSIVQLLEWRPLVSIGVVSYGVYLLHKLVLDLVNRTLLGLHLPYPELLFVFCLLGSLAVAALSYRYFEHPILRIKDKFRTESPQHRANDKAAAASR